MKLITEAEWDYLRLLHDGLTRAQIAERLNITANTVKSRRRTLLAKFAQGVTVEEMYAFAKQERAELGLVKL